MKTTLQTIVSVGDSLIRDSCGLVTSRRKPCGEFVTPIDLQSSNAILTATWPDFPDSYSEEHRPEILPTSQAFWVFDTLDGTDEYIKGRQRGYAVQGALYQRNDSGTYDSVAGIIYQPGINTAIVAQPGRAPRLYCNNEEAQIPVPDLSKLRGFVREVDYSARLADFYHELGARLGLEVELVLGGGSGSSFVSLATGDVNLVVMPYNYSKEWDIGPADPFMKHSGGFLLDLAGRPFSYNRRDPLNYNGYIASFFPPEKLFPLPADLLEDRLGQAA